MKRRLAIILSTYIIFLLIFILQKPLFMLATYAVWTIYDGVPFTEWLKVMWHGLPLDLSLAGYLTVIPSLIIVASVWTVSRVLRKIMSWYFILVCGLMAFVFVLDTALYPYWGFKLDTTPFFYLLSSPADALASTTTPMLMSGFVSIVFLYAVYYYVLWRFPLKMMRWKYADRILNPVICTLGLLPVVGLLFIPIRGGFTVSTMNVGKVYYSIVPSLNHAATNPLFTLLESIVRSNDFADRYRFMDDTEASSIFSELTYTDLREPKRETVVIDSLASDTVISPDLQLVDSVARGPVTDLLAVSRPDILFIILESFSSHLMSELGGESPVAVNLDSLGKEGVLFTNFFANSFRTDRGLVSILSGYPAQPTTSIMKYPRKTQNLPSIAGALKKAGYQTGYYYGGDADFTNMRSYLMSAGFDTIISDTDFPVKERLSKWGVHDHLVFDRLLSDIKKTSSSASPMYRVVQTSSSHEPFEVPYSRLDNPRLNAFAYTDSCVGAFIDAYRKLPQWDSTLVVIVPDHQGVYPEGISNFELGRYRIPLIFVGGAVEGPLRIDTYGSQQDIAATLLGQLGLPHHDFTFSKDMLDSDSPHFAFFAVPDAFGMVDKDNAVIYDCQADVVVVDQGPLKGKNVQPGKAYLQKLYDDISAR